MGFKDAERAYEVDLPLTKKAVLVAIAHATDDKTHQTYLGRKSIATRIGVDPKTVQRALGDLAREGWIKREERFNDNGYRLTDLLTFTPDLGDSLPPGQPASEADDPKVGDSPSLPGGQRVQAINHPERDHPERDHPDGGAQKRGTRIPEPFIVTADMRQWASHEVPAVDVDASTRIFVDHWRAATGRNATKLDWTATWRNWLRRDATQKRPQSRPETPKDRIQRIVSLGEQLQAQTEASRQELTA